MDDADWEIQEMQAISPGETLSHVAGTHPTSDPARLGILLDDLRRAGLPE